MQITGKVRINIPNGSIYGTWTVLKEVEPLTYPSNTIRQFSCRCGCGRVQDVALTNLRSGASTRCEVCRAHHIKSVKTLEEAREIVADVRSGESRKSVAARHGITLNVLQAIMLGRTWPEATAVD